MHDAASEFARAVRMHENIKRERPLIQLKYAAQSAVSPKSNFKFGMVHEWSGIWTGWALQGMRLKSLRSLRISQKPRFHSTCCKNIHLPETKTLFFSKVIGHRDKFKLRLIEVKWRSVKASSTNIFSFT